MAFILPAVFFRVGVLTVVLTTFACGGRNLEAEAGPGMTLANAGVRKGISLTCGTGAWCFVHPFPTGLNLHNISSTADDDVWFVGEQGTALRFDGTRWQGETGNDRGNVVAVAGPHPDDVWVVHDRDGLLRWDGRTWRSVYVALGARLARLAVRTPNDAWVASTDGTPFHFDGMAWSAISGVTGQVAGIAPVASDDAWIATSAGLYRWRGGKTVARTSVVTRADGVWVTGTNELFVRSRSDVLRGDGTTWTVMPWPVSALEVVAGSTTEDLYAVARGGALYRWDGATLSDQHAPFPPLTAHRTKGGDVWIIGQRSRIARLRKGTWWSPPGNDAFDGDLQALSMWGASHDDIYLAGAQTLRHFDGVAWSVRERFDGFVDAVAGTSSDDVWIAGPRPPLPPMREAVLLHREGGRWVRHTIPDVKPVYRLHARARDDVWGVTGDMPIKVVHWDGRAWTVERPMLDLYDAYSIVARGRDDVWIAGTGGLAHFNGKMWKLEQLGTDRRSSVSATLAVPDRTGHLWLALRSQPDGATHLATFDGTTLTTRLRPVGDAGIAGIWPNDGALSWVFSANGIHVFDGVDWTRIATIQLGTRLWSAREGDVWAYGTTPMGAPLLLRRWHRETAP